MINCNSCGQLIREELTVCPFCGTIRDEKTVFVNTSNQMGYVPPQPAMNQPGSYGQSGMQPQQMSYGQQTAINQLQQSSMNQQPGDYGQSKPIKVKKVKGGGSKGKLIALVSIIAVLVIATVFAIILFTGPGALTQKGAVEAYLESMADKDAKAYIKACYPTKLYKAKLKHFETEIGITEDEVIDKIKFNIKSFGDGQVAVKDIKITGSEEYDKDIVKLNNERDKENFGINVNRSKIVKLTVEYKSKDRNGTWHDRCVDIDVYKVGFKWYVSERYLTLTMISN